MTARFDSPGVILTGGGCRRQAAELLSSLRARETLLVADPFFAASEFVLELQIDLKRAGISCHPFSDFQPDPTDRNVAAGVERFRAIGGDSILAIGGGSAIDVAKIIGVASTSPESKATNSSSV